jgi:hypothetical protein
MANRLVLGAFDGTFVLRASVPGSDVLSTSLAPSKIAFDSRWADMMRIIQHGNVTLASGASTTITHGLGFVPMAAAWMYKNAADPDMMSQEYGTRIELKATTTTLAIRHSVGSTFSIKYVIFNMGATG